MQTGRAAPLDGIIAAARAKGARILLDVTQAVPMVEVADRIADIDFLVCAGYKHLLCPRGVAFLYVRPDAGIGLWPRNANWRAADPPYGHYFGGPLALPDTAARFDISLAWFSWVGARESLARLVTWQAAGALAAVRDAAGVLSRSLGAAATGATLVCLPVANPAGLAKALRRERIRASMRGGLLRLAPHVYNTDEELRHVTSVVRPFLAAVSD
jgi:selenocysteine lyase/cysteine desulfurase